MIQLKWKVLVGCILMGALFLAACSNEGNTKQENTKGADQQEQQKADSTQTSPNKETTVEESLPPIKEAKNIPPKEKKALLAVFDQYVKAFNDKDLEAYMKTISKNPTSFKIDEEKAYIKKIFDTMDIELEPKTILIIKYKDTEAYIFTEMKTKVAEAGSENKIEKTSRQVNTLRKEEGQWKITSTFAMETK